MVAPISVVVRTIVVIVTAVVVGIIAPVVHRIRVAISGANRYTKVAVSLCVGHGPPMQAPATPPPTNALVKTLQGTMVSNAEKGSPAFCFASINAESTLAYKGSSQQFVFELLKQVSIGTVGL